jgi:hypothetical protein
VEFHRGCLRRTAIIHEGWDSCIVGNLRFPCRSFDNASDIGGVFLFHP